VSEGRNAVQRPEVWMLRKQIENAKLGKRSLNAPCL
jgi:hypothetical protein